MKIHSGGHFVISKQLFFRFFRAVFSLSDCAKEHGHDEHTRKYTPKPQRFRNQHDDQPNQQEEKENPIDKPINMIKKAASGLYGKIVAFHGACPVNFTMYKPEPKENDSDLPVGFGNRPSGHKQYQRQERVKALCEWKEKVH